MQFLSKLLKRETVETPPMMAVADHERIVKAKLKLAAQELAGEIMAKDERIKTQEWLIKEANRVIGEMRGEINSLKPDALAHRARLKRDREYHANRRQAREKQAAE